MAHNLSQRAEPLLPACAHTPSRKAPSPGLHSHAAGLGTASSCPHSLSNALNTKVCPCKHLRGSGSRDLGNAETFRSLQSSRIRQNTNAQCSASHPCLLQTPSPPGEAGAAAPTEISPAGSTFCEVWGHLMAAAGSTAPSVPPAALLCSIHLQ